MHKLIHTLALLTLGSLTAASAQAHQIWLEQAPGAEGATLNFGEFGDNLRETSPGLLDKLGRPMATLLSPRGERQQALTKKPHGFVLPFQAAQGESIVAEDALYPLYAMPQVGPQAKGWYVPAARLVTQWTAQPPRLTFDLVTTGTPGELKVVFKGQALAKVKVNLVTASGWAKEARSDEQGLVKFDLPWRGTYVAEASHSDKTPGERTGLQGPEKYDAASYVTTLTYVQADGLPALPASPAATPSR